MPDGASRATRLAARAVIAAALAAVVAAFAMPAVAGAASVAYVDKGEVWLASLDGAKKARLAAPVVNANGETEEWLDVAQSDGGRIVAVRNKPGRMSNFSWFKIWEPDGSSSVEGPLNAPAVGPCTSIRSASTSPRTGRTSSTGTRTRAPAARSRSLVGRTSGRRPTARSIRSTPAARRIPRSSARGSSRRGHLVAGGRQRPERGWRQSLHERLHRVARHLGRRARPRRRRRRGQRAPGGARLRGVQRRHADGRQDRRPRDPGGGSGARLPGRRGLLPARGRHRAGRIARAGRRGDRVEGRRRREGRRQPLDRGPIPA